jgi:hypothetical protein
MHKNDLAHLESIGPEAVLKEMAAGAHGMAGSQMRDEVDAWLRSEQIAADALASSKRDAREEETLSIAKFANRIASRAERWAMYAAIAAVIALIISIVRSQN